jgi:hypothetical protein
LYEKYNSIKDFEDVISNRIANRIDEEKRLNRKNKLNSKLIKSDIKTIDEYLMNAKDKSCEDFKEIRNTNLIIAEINFEIFINNTLHHISFPLNTGSDLAIFSDVSEKAKEHINDILSSSYMLLNSQKFSINTKGTNSIEEYLLNEKHVGDNTIHSEKSLLGHLFDDILVRKESIIANDLHKHLKYLLTKDTKNIHFHQIWLNIFSTREICDNCIMLLSDQNLNLVNGIAEKIKSMTENISVYHNIDTLYKDIIYNLPYCNEKISEQTVL